MRDLEIWLEAAPGSYPVPPECYASLRRGGATDPLEPPTRCVPNGSCRLGDVGSDEGPVVIDIFQRVGSISVGGRLQSGALVDGTVTWSDQKGCEVIRLRAAVLSVGSGPPVASTPSLVTPTPEKEKEEKKVDVPKVRLTVPDLPEVEPEPTEQILPPPLQTPHAGVIRSPRNEEARMPIVLNNCDQIIPNLYLGGIDAASDTDQLVAQGVRAVCCCVRELEFPTREFNSEVEYYRVDVEDISREPIEYYFQEAADFIHSWVSREQPVLVHCRAGVSRSASVVIAYLIAHHGYSLHDAFFLARTRRAIVTPNIGFMEKLGEFEESIRDTEPTIEINKYMAWYTAPDRAAVPDLKPD